MGWGGYGFSRWRPYVSVDKKLSNATKNAAKLAKKQGREPSPVKLESKKIATTFWGKAWCDNLASYSDYSNRLPRGATYVRNGSVVDLLIKPRKIEAIVAGSETYTIKIEIAALAKSAWQNIKKDCASSINSLLDFLAGQFSASTMERLTRQKDGLFPSPKEIKMNCSCPDWSDCCKHLAAVMYGVGARLDKQPELLFLLRDVDHQELITQAIAEGNLEKELSADVDGSLAGQDLESIFGIELDSNIATPPKPKASTSRRRVKSNTSSKSETNVASELLTAKKTTRKAKTKFAALDDVTVPIANEEPKGIKKAVKKTSALNRLLVKKLVVKHSIARKKSALKPKKAVKRLEVKKPASRKSA